MFIGIIGKSYFRYDETIDIIDKIIGGKLIDNMSTLP